VESMENQFFLLDYVSVRAKSACECPHFALEVWVCLHFLLHLGHVSLLSQDIPRARYMFLHMSPLWRA